MINHKLTFLILLSVNYTVENRDDGIFKKQKEVTYMKPRHLIKKKNYTYYPINQLNTFNVYLSRKALIIDKQKLYKVGFGSFFIKDQYLVKMHNQIYLLTLDSANRPNKKTLLFDFLNCSIDTNIIDFGMIENHKMVLNNIEINKTDTILKYALKPILKSDTIRLKNGYILKESHFKDEKNYFHELVVSSKYGIVSITKEEAYYTIRYEK